MRREERQKRRETKGFRISISLSQSFLGARAEQTIMHVCVYAYRAFFVCYAVFTSKKKEKRRDSVCGFPCALLSIQSHHNLSLSLSHRLSLAKNHASHSCTSACHPLLPTVFILRWMNAFDFFLPLTSAIDPPSVSSRLLQCLIAPLTIRPSVSDAGVTSSARRL
jgi:hypothetical protein